MKSTTLYLMIMCLLRTLTLMNIRVTEVSILTPLQLRIMSIKRVLIQRIYLYTGSCQRTLVLAAFVWTTLISRLIQGQALFATKTLQMSQILVRICLFPSLTFTCSNFLNELKDLQTKAESTRSIRLRKGRQQVLVLLQKLVQVWFRNHCLAPTVNYLKS